MRTLPNLVKILKKNLSAGNLWGTSETIRTNSNFSFWLAGLIDGDGTLNISKKGYVSCEIVLHKKEIQTLYFIKSIMGGSVSEKTDKGVRWRLHNKPGILKLINLINGKLLLKSQKLEQICNLYHIPVNINTPPFEDNSWLSGFIDAEGSFNYNTANNKMSLSISHKKREILDLISQKFKGNVYFDKSWEGYIYYISSAKDLNNLLDYFNKYPLKIKNIDLIFFKRLIQMRKLKYHLPNSENHTYFLKVLNKLKNR